MTDEQTSSGGFFRRLWRGELGLVKTFWLHFVLVDVVGLLLLEAIEGLPPFVSVSVFVLILAYLGIAAGGVWRAAEDYKGPVAWQLLAKVAVVLYAVQLLAIVLTLLGWAVSLIP